LHHYPNNALLYFVQGPYPLSLLFLGLGNFLLILRK
jgi:hypothetical protein